MIALVLAVVALAACDGIRGTNPTPAPAGSAASPSTESPSAAPSSPSATPAPDASCAGEGSLRSENGDTPTDLEFVNRTGITVQTLWLNYEGARVFYREVPEGSSYVQPTFVTHPWVVADLEGTCLLLVVADGNRHTVQVGP
jgi:hypothetical protein